jgi:hypothetical protein
MGDGDTEFRIARCSRGGLFKDTDVPEYYGKALVFLDGMGDQSVLTPTLHEHRSLLGQGGRGVGRPLRPPRRPLRERAEYARLSLDFLADRLRGLAT